jgi:hypothetical protein
MAEKLSDGINTPDNLVHGLVGEGILCWCGHLTATSGTLSAARIIRQAAPAEKMGTSAQAYRLHSHFLKSLHVKKN